MSKIIVCYKWVKAEEDLRIDPSTLNVDLGKAKGKISDYDRNAIETARLIGVETGEEVVGLTFGSSDAKPSLKDSLSRGLSQGFRVNEESASLADGFVTSNVLKAAVEKIGDYKLIVCAEGAADTYAHQTGPRIAALLGIPVISCVSEIRVEGNKLTAKRKLEDSIETIEAELPAVITVLPEINNAPTPGLKAVLDAGKKPVTEFKFKDLGLADEETAPKESVSSFKGYVMSRKNIIFSEGSAPEKVSALVASLKKEGVL